MSESKMSTLQKCKKVIQELSQQLSFMTQQNERLMNEQKRLTNVLQEMQENNNNLNHIVTQMKTSNDDLLKKLEAQSQQSQKNIRAKELLYTKQTQQKISLQKRLSNAQSIINELQLEIGQITSQKTLLEETLHLMNIERGMLRRKCQEKEGQVQMEVMRLKQVNSQLKKKFDAMDLDCTSIDNYDCRNYLYQSPFARQKEDKQNALSDDNKESLLKKCNEISNGTNETELGKAHPAPKNQYSPQVSQFRPNPELGDQIKHLKRQIYQQYSKIQVHRQSLNHERVSRTLAAIQKTIGKMVKVVQRNDNSSLSD